MILLARIRDWGNCYAATVLSAVFSATVLAQDPVPPPAVEPAAATVPATVAVETNRPVNFRSASPSLNTAGSGERVSTDRASNELEALLDQRDELEAEMRRDRIKAEAARKRLDVLRSLGQSEEADRLHQETLDSEARTKTRREELARVDEEIARLQGNSDASPDMLNGEEIILPGINLELWVNEDPSFNGRHQVRRGGYVILPQIGRVMVAGKTIAQAEAAVRKALQATQLRRASVMLERLDGQDIEERTILLAGEFRHPRPFKIPHGTAPTLVSVLIASGGWTERADLTRVKVMRMAANRSVVEEVNVKKILEGNPAVGLGGDVTLTEGDVIVVPSGALNLVYVTGRVKKAGSYKIGENEKLTVYGAILQSGGFDHFAAKSKVHVLRSMPDGTKAKLPVSIDAVVKGRRPDVILQPNDIIVVPEKWFSW